MTEKFSDGKKTSLCTPLGFARKYKGASKTEHVFHLQYSANILEMET